LIGKFDDDNDKTPCYYELLRSASNRGFNLLLSMLNVASQADKILPNLCSAQPIMHKHAECLRVLQLGTNHNHTFAVWTQCGQTSLRNFMVIASVQ
jgi:hypothetical protein